MLSFHVQPYSKVEGHLGISRLTMVPPAILELRLLSRSLRARKAAAQLKAIQQYNSDSGNIRERGTWKKQLKAISWAGSGLYFFWQLGAMKYLAERYDLTKVHQVGASGGSIIATLAACRVKPEVVIRKIQENSKKFGVWEETAALTGMWGALLEQWLHDILPDDAAGKCNGHVTVVVTALPDMKQMGITHFNDKKDLIDVIMASCFVPLVLDSKLTRSCRGMECVDGSLPDFFWGNCDLLTINGDAIVFDYFDDKLLDRDGRMDMLKITSFEVLIERLDLGYRYARRLHAKGRFRGFQIESLKKWGSQRL